MRTALEELFEYGPAELSMSRIAGHLGLAISAMYRHFSGKDEIIDAVIDLIGSRLEVNLSTACHAVETPLERLFRVILGHPSAGRFAVTRYAKRA